MVEDFATGQFDGRGRPTMVIMMLTLLERQPHGRPRPSHDASRPLPDRPLFGAPVECCCARTMVAVDHLNGIGPTVARLQRLQHGVPDTGQVQRRNLRQTLPQFPKTFFCRSRHGEDRAGELEHAVQNALMIGGSVPASPATGFDELQTGRPIVIAHQTITVPQDISGSVSGQIGSRAVDDAYNLLSR